MSEQGLILAIDVGTTSCKCAAIDFTGLIVDELTINYPTYYPKEGWVEQHPEDWLKGLQQAISTLVRNLGSRTKEICVIGLTGQKGGVVFSGS